MNAVRILRAMAGLTQRQLATAAGTSQSTVAAYESGAKSPTLRTVDGLARAVGLEMAPVFVPRMSREDRRSLAFHRAVADHVRRDPHGTVSRARQHLEGLLRRAHPHATVLLDAWRDWLALAPPRLIEKLLDPDVHAREMRQVSPFAGVLTPQERAQILRRFRREERG